MKYWHQLSNVEEAIFQVRKIRSQLSVMMDSELIASSNTDKFPETYKDFLYDLSERFEDAMSTLNVEFQNLWNTIREDSFEEEKSELPNDRWTHIVKDLQNWNEQSMASQPNSDDTISLGVLDINQPNEIMFNLNDIQPIANLDFDFSFGDNMYSSR
jgi:hypothetical protein